MLRLLIALGLAVASRPAIAQDIYPVYDMGILTGTLANNHNTQAARKMARGNAPVRRDLSYGEQAIGGLGGILGGNSLVPAGAAATAGTVDLGYRITPALQREAVEGYIARISRQNPGAAQVMRTQLSRQNYAAIYNGMIKDSTLRSNDAADAVTFYTLIGWQIANKDPAEISDAKIEAVRRQLAPALAANAQIAAPATRAALGEEMKLLALTLHAGWQSAMKEGRTRQYSDGIARMWQAQTGRDLRAVKLTNAGFSRR